ncbi:hypothetical protein [Caldiplasma sukawensis]
MRKSLPIIHRLDRELLVSDVSMELMNKNVYDKSGKKIGKIVRILGRWENPHGIVVLNSDIETDEIFL